MPQWDGNLFVLRTKFAVFVYPVFFFYKRARPATFIHRWVRSSLETTLSMLGTAETENHRKRTVQNSFAQLVFLPFFWERTPSAKEDNPSLLTFYIFQRFCRFSNFVTFSLLFVAARYTSSSPSKNVSTYLQIEHIVLYIYLCTSAA